MVFVLKTIKLFVNELTYGFERCLYVMNPEVNERNGKAVEKSAFSGSEII